MDARSDPDPLKVVLLQEVQRYNKLLDFLHTTLGDLIKAMQGLVSVTPLVSKSFNVDSTWFQRGFNVVLEWEWFGVRVFWSEHRTTPRTTPRTTLRTTPRTTPPI